ncbi:DDE-type integrase/transposase/recombinase [Chromobacterium subtsugae]|uniref:DDE-type integrase/transposase/recombinase n=1 Tax=Chromobacterium subtsugae TaxID=251747 RepID=A0ABS7FJH6_9NEIS|nr:MULTISPECIES: Mu transposase C-terminal domain-containing protein [Chromobacterium]MBW7569079.1 transposase family protein [Chromobacterium subtsugae]MBW8290141.1 DDE-type integrase/transposase/recombinase [Chromobacterium subtsugae]WSE93704.1 Mu transposase C-terminal domain-containing protein [Chromobacterium subtsugae]WVH62081.1 Mu transposase C-terminal domain-containing protein [Chromobacterium subtsugae]
MTDKSYLPRAGLRFAIYGSEFEVTYVAAGMVRYAATAGGKPYRIPYERFMEMQASSTLLILNSELERISADGIDRKLPELDQRAMREMVRHARYVEAAVTQLSHPRSVKRLEKLIPVLAAEFADVDPPAPRTVAWWVQKYFQESKAVTAFIPREHLRGNRTLRFSPQVEMLITEGIQQVYLLPERRHAKDVLAHIVGKFAEQGLLDAHSAVIKLPSLRTIERRIKDLDPYVITMAKRGKVAADRVARAAGRQILSPRAMFLVQIDTLYLDILLIDPESGEVIGRPYLVCIIDVYTRAVVGVYISMFPPSATTTLAAVKDMLTRQGRGLPGGVPVRIIPDNGVDFKNSAFVRLCGQLGIITVPAEIQDPNDKAHIESFFRTLTYSLTQKLTGTTFSCPIDRGEYDSRRRATLMLERLQEYILEWINEVYHKTIHTRTGRAPILAWEDATKGWSAPAFSAEEINAIARWPWERSIHKGRVLIDGIEYFSHPLATLEVMGETRVTVLVDELDLHSVYVEHPSERGTLILAESTNPDYTLGLTWYAHQEVKKLRKEMSKADLRRLGQYAYMLAWWKLLEKIQTDSTLAKRQIAKLTNGKGRSQLTTAALLPPQDPPHLGRTAPVEPVSIPTSVPMAPPASLPEHEPKPALPAADVIACSYAIITLE